jgi:hypothetical protein
VNEPIACDDGDVCTGEELCLQSVGCRQTSFPPITEPACFGELAAYTCYKARKTMGATDVFDAIPGLPVEDEFGQGTIALSRTQELCLPTSVNGSDPEAPTFEDHLEGYKAKRVGNVFGTIRVNAKTPSALHVPTAMSPVTLPGLPSLPNPDTFSCYKVKVTTGSLFTPILGVTLDDSFGSLVVNVTKPTRLCNPASVQGSDPDAPAHPLHLLCYRITSSSIGPPFIPRMGLRTANAFGPEQLNATKPQELCLPSLVSTTPGPTVTPSPTITPGPSGTPGT